MLVAMALMTVLALTAWLALQPAASPRESPQSVLQQAFDSLRPHSAPSGAAWADVCRTEPGEDAPSWAKTHLRALYLGGSAARSTDPAPGASGGCTGRTLIPRGGDGNLVYTIAVDESGSMSSVATVSKRFGPAIFMAPAAEPTFQLLRTYLDIGGWARTPVGHGDFYGVTTPKGTAILVRPNIMRGDGSRQAEPYVTLMPAAAARWMKAMDDASSWLWAVPDGTVNGKQRIRLVANLATSTAVDTIFIDPATGRARLASDDGWHSAGRRIDQANVKALARLAT